MAFALYITHPQIRMEPDVPVPNWGLSEVGMERAKEASKQGWAKTLARIASSEETKAVETAQIFAEISGASVEIVDGMGENDRSATGFLPPHEFEKAADAFFAKPTESFKGWEKAVDAQMRIVEAFERVLQTHDHSKPLAFIGHGGVGTLLKCHLAGLPISRQFDQPAGGGNLFCFDLAKRVLKCDWTPMEKWTGWSE